MGSPETAVPQGERPSSTPARSRIPRWLPTLVIVLAVGVAAVLVWVRGSGAASTATVAVGYEAPNFTLSALAPTGQAAPTIRLADLRGKVVLVNFWATWCPPCQAEMPDLEALYRAHPNGDFVILGVDQTEDAATVRSFVAPRGFTWTFLLDADGEVSRLYDAHALPTSILVDRTGQVDIIWVGPLTRSALERRLSAMGAK